MTANDQKHLRSPAPASPTSPSQDNELSEAFVLLDNSSGSDAASLLFTDPVSTISAWEPEDVPEALGRLEGAVADGLHAAGFLAYELGYVLEPKLARRMPAERTMPLIWFGLYRSPRRMTGREVEGWLEATTRSASHQFSDVSLAWNEAEYVTRFDKVLEKIRAGDIYQLNLTFKARFRLEGSPLTFYRDLRAKQRVAYGGIVDTGAATVLSASPELFIEKTGQIIETRPMKGTAARKGLIRDDARQMAELSSDAKQRAENLMIVDLMRNDLGRISETGSVEVTDLFTVETYKTLHQMTSGVRAKLKPSAGMDELLRAIFPPGSVTGAPKIRAMELISDYETEARGVYCGAIGRISPNDTAMFNVVIRTPVVFRDGSGEMGIGSGVVYDSVGRAEYAECLLKMKFLTDPPKPFQLIETMLYEPVGGFWLLDRHMARLTASASYFGFKFVAQEVIAALGARVDEAGRERRLRVRMTLAEDGQVAVTATQIDDQPADAVMRYVVSPTRLNSANPFLFHKTTRRDLYDEEWAHFKQTAGADEVVYLNESGELCEGSRTSVFIERDGVLLTPPLAAGLLPGTLRADLLESGRAVEARLWLEDLNSADVAYLGNSVRGLVRAEQLAAQTSEALDACERERAGSAPVTN